MESIAHKKDAISLVLVFGKTKKLICPIHGFAPFRTLTSERDERPQPFVAKEEPSPNQHTDIDREQSMRKERISDS